MPRLDGQSDAMEAADEQKAMVTNLSCMVRLEAAIDASEAAPRSDASGRACGRAVPGLVIWWQTLKRQAWWKAKTAAKDGTMRCRAEEGPAGTGAG